MSSSSQERWSLPHWVVEVGVTGRSPMRPSTLVRRTGPRSKGHSAWRLDTEREDKVRSRQFFVFLSSNPWKSGLLYVTFLPTWIFELSSSETAFWVPKVMRECGEISVAGRRPWSSRDHLIYDICIQSQQLGSCNWSLHSTPFLVFLLHPLHLHNDVVSINAPTIASSNPSFLTQYSYKTDSPQSRSLSRAWDRHISRDWRDLTGARSIDVVGSSSGDSTFSSNMVMRLEWSTNRDWLGWILASF